MKNSININLILIFTILIYCNPFTSKKKPPDLEPTIIKYPKNDIGNLFYSKDSLPYETVLKNLIKIYRYDGNPVKNTIAPKYPLELYEDNILDTMVVSKVHVDQNGVIESIIILKSGGDYLDNNMIDALRNWEFASNKETHYYLEIPFRFRFK